MGDDTSTPPGHAITRASNGRARFGTFEVDFHAGELRKSGVKIKLHGQPFEVLAMLLERPGEVITREEMQRKLFSDTFVDFEHGLNKAINKLREALGDDPENPRFIETLHRRGYRFIAPVDGPSSPAVERNEPLPGPAATRAVSKNWASWQIWVAVVLVTLAAGGYFYLRRTPRLRDKDRIVLADFTNTTGDPVFDGTLREGLAVQMEQSPFFSLVSDQQIQHTLRLMKQPPDARLTPDIALEVCQRTSSAAVLGGSIAQIGTQYSLILKAVNCSNGESVAGTEVQASDKSHVLEALGRESSEIRRKLGESINSIQKFDAPLEQATTPSLEALQAYSLGWKLLDKGDSGGSIPFFQQAIKLDPNFAGAYNILGGRYEDAGETALAAENMRKAFELRASVSERERLGIEAGYEMIVPRDLLKALRASEVWAETYPRDWESRNLLGYIYDELGQVDKAVGEYREALRFYPESGLIYENLVFDYIALNRLDEARVTLEEARTKDPDLPFVLPTLYQLAFLQKDAAAMEQQVTAAAGKPGLEDMLLAFEADTAAYSGRLQRAREFSRQAVASSKRAEEMAATAGYEGDAALREALFGYAGEARQWATSALRHSNAPSVQYMAALALALTGDAARAQALAEELGKRFPEGTIVQFEELPTLHAQLALNSNDAPKAIAALQAAVPYEVGAGLYPAYFRGIAYLAAHRSNEAASELQKILDLRGIVLNSPIGVLAHLQLGRAYTMQGDNAKARAAYQDFLALWKDADPDIPILKQAKGEYTKLQ